LSSGTSQTVGHLNSGFPSSSVYTETPCWEFTRLPETFDPSTVEIRGSDHIPPDAWEVPQLVEEMCDYINDNWDTATPLHLAAYSMWRMNWIHPFADGNGRTARAVPYMNLCMKMQSRIPGPRTLPDQIAGNKKPYYDALEAADGHWTSQKAINLTELEVLLGDLLAAQLVSALEQASGKLIN
jgi:Fic family protein